MPHFSDIEREDRAGMTSLVPQAGSTDAEQLVRVSCQPPMMMPKGRPRNKESQAESTAPTSGRVARRRRRLEAAVKNAATSRMTRQL